MAGPQVSSARVPTSPQSVVTRFDSSRRRWFGPAAEQPFRRRTTDWLRLGTAVVVLALLGAHVGHLTPPELNVFRFFNTLPSGLHSAFETLDRVGGLWALALVVTAALLARRWRLARDLVVAGAAAWGLARLVGLLVVEHQSFRASLNEVTRLGNSTPPFPAARLALVVAVVAGASPYLTRPWRRVNAALIVALFIAGLYLGVGYPNDLLGGVVLGWGVAAAVHLLFGSPGGHPTIDQVTDSLAELGVAATGVRLAPIQPPVATLFLAEDPGGPLWVKVLGRDETDAQLLAKMVRFMLYKDSGPVFFWTRLGQLQYEAYALLLAREGGTRAPKVLIAGTAGPSAALLVARPAEGPPLRDADASSVSDSLLDDLWVQVAAMHSARVAHGELNAAHVALASDGPTLVDFRLASATAEPRRAAADVAELLTATAAIVGEQRAVDAVVHAVGAEPVRDALPFLQPAALSRETRVAAAQSRKVLHDRLEQLRKLCAAAIGCDEPKLEQLRRISTTNLLLAVGTLIAAFALLSQVGNPSQLVDAITRANAGWLLVAFALSMATNVGFAIALQGTVPNRLPPGATTELQVAMSFSNLAIPAVGGTGFQIRFLQKQGVDLTAAIAAGGLLSTAAMVVTQLALFGLAVWLAPNKLQLGNLDAAGILQALLIVVLALGVAAAAILGIPRLRRAALPPIEHGAATIFRALRSPRQLVLLIAGNVIAAVLYGYCLQTCLLAFGAHLSLWSLLAANIFLGTLASLIPIPGGGTAVTSVGLSGALVAFGVPTEIAVAAVLANQLVVNYLPAVPGWFATTHLIRRGYM